MHYPLTWSNTFCYGRGKRGALVKKARAHSREMMLYIFWVKCFWGKRRWKTRGGQMIKLCLFFQNCHFWAYIKKISTFTFGARLVLLVHIRFTPSEGPKGFVNWFFKKSDHQVGSWKRPSSKVRFHGPWCRPTLSNCHVCFQNLKACD